MAKEAGQRAARHNGRGGKNGAYSAKHSDRNFDVSEAEHIDPELMHLNIHQRFAGEFEGVKTNEEYELAFYEAHFGESLARKNAAYKAKGKSGQIKTMEEYHQSMKSCPEETYYTAGEGVDRDLLWQIYSEHQAWKAQRFPLCQTLTADLHADEPGAMLHIHERSVWIGHDKQGMEVVGQNKALEEMGVLPPDPEKKTGKYNNAKQTFTQECRENFLQICREHGLEIVTEPKPSGEVGLELLEYQIQHAKEREKEAKEQLQEMQDQTAAAVDQLATITRETVVAQTKATELGSQIKAAEGTLEGLRGQTKVAEGELAVTIQAASAAQVKVAELGSQIEASEVTLGDLRKQLVDADRRLKVAVQNAATAEQALGQVLGRLETAEEDLQDAREAADDLISAMASQSALERVQAKPVAFGGGVKLSQADYEKIYQTAKAAAAARYAAEETLAGNRRLRQALNRQQQLEKELRESARQAKEQLYQQEQELSLLRTLWRHIVEFFTQQPTTYRQYRQYREDEAVIGRMDWRLQAQLDQVMGTNYAAEDKARYFAQRGQQQDFEF